MKTVSVSDSRDDGAALVIGESPWYAVLLAWLAGSCNPRWRFDYRLWSAVLNWCDRRNRDLVRVPVSHSCKVAEKLWGSDYCYHTAARIAEGGDGGWSSHPHCGRPVRRGGPWRAPTHMRKPGSGETSG